jgi:putative inorganic carbon (hco3(-)) transporter
MTASVLAGTNSPAAWGAAAARQGIQLALWPVQAAILAPTGLFLAALTAMLLRPPDVPFYEIDRLALVLLVLAVAARAVVRRERVFLVERASFPMIGLTLLAGASVVQQPFDCQSWSLLTAKFVAPFALFHVAGSVFRDERRIRHFEWFGLLVLAYLSFTAIAFLLDAKSLIFPRFILDESLGYHADRARGPFLQAVANGVSLNLLGLLALQAFFRRRIRGLGAALLLALLPVAILATMTRAVWLSFAVSVGVLIIRSHNRKLRWICVAVSIAGAVALLIALNFDDQRRALTERLRESGPVEFRQAVYAGGWQMFLEKPIAGWGVNQMPEELARHVSGYRKRELYPHNTYLEILIEHGLVGLLLYGWLMWEVLRLGRGPIPRAEHDGFLNQQFHALWPVLLGVYWINAAVVGMNYQFVNGFLFSLAGMLAAQQRRFAKTSELDSSSPLKILRGFAA